MAIVPCLLLTGACQQSDDIVGGLAVRRLDSTPPGCDELAALRAEGLVHDWVSVAEDCRIPLEWTPLWKLAHPNAWKGQDAGVSSGEAKETDESKRGWTDTPADDAMLAKLLWDRALIPTGGMPPSCGDTEKWFYDFNEREALEHVLCPALCEYAVTEIEARLATGCASIAE